MSVVTLCREWNDGTEEGAKESVRESDKMPHKGGAIQVIVLKHE